MTQNNPLLPLRSTRCDSDRDGWTRKEDHPVWMLTQTPEPELIMHPLVLGLIEQKWWLLGNVYALNFALHVVYAALLVAFIILLRPFANLDCLKDEGVVPPIWNCSLFHTSSVCEEELAEVKRLASFEDIYSIRILSYSLAWVFVAMEIGQMLMRPKDYWDRRNCFDAVFLQGSLLFLVDFHPECPVPVLSAWQWNLGTVSTFFAFMTVLLELRDFPSLGSFFVSMFLHVLGTFLKVGLAVVLYFISFGFLLYTILPSKEGPTRLMTDFMQIVGMTLGEIDLSDLMEHAESMSGLDKGFALAFFFLFCVCMPIGLMNLLVGLAVSDVGAMKRDANVTVLVSKLKAILALEFSFHHSIACRLGLLCREEESPFPAEWCEKSVNCAIEENRHMAHRPKCIRYQPNATFFNRIRDALSLHVSCQDAQEMVRVLNQHFTRTNEFVMKRQLRELKEKIDGQLLRGVNSPLPSFPAGP